MLVLTRKLMEKLFIGDDICVTVVRLEGGQVRLGIEAPREITVVRAELVPDRQAGHGRQPGSAALGPVAPNPAYRPPTPPSPLGAGPNGSGRGEFRNPPAAVHGSGTRRRGRSR